MPCLSRMATGLQPWETSRAQPVVRRWGVGTDVSVLDGEGGIRTLERGFPRYAISSRARSTAPAPLQTLDHHQPVAPDLSSVGGH